MSNPYPEYKRNTITVPLAEQPAQPQQEPVARLQVFMESFDMGQSLAPNTEYKFASASAYQAAKMLPLGNYDLYTSPPASKPLTDEEYEALVEDLGDWSRYVEVDTAHQTLTEHVRQVLAAHGIKGDA